MTKKKKRKKRKSVRLIVSLTDDECIAIANSDVTNIILSKQYGVTRGHISNIKKGNRRSLATGKSNK